MIASRPWARPATMGPRRLGACGASLMFIIMVLGDEEEVDARDCRMVDEQKHADEKKAMRIVHAFGILNDGVLPNIS